MSLIPRRSGESPEEQAKAARYLVRQCGLTEADVDRILDLQRTEELSFTEAALRLGLASQSDVDSALARPEPLKASADARAAEELLAVHDPFNPYTEQLRALRQELLLMSPLFPARGYLLGEAYNLVDCAWAALGWELQTIGAPLDGAGHLETYLRRLFARPAFGRSLDNLGLRQMADA